MHFFIPWTEEPGGYSPWGCKELDMTGRLKSNSNYGSEWNQTDTWAQDHTQAPREGICVCVCVCVCVCMCVCVTDRKNDLKKYYYHYKKWINTEQSLRWYLKEINLRFSRINQDDILSENVETFYQFPTKITQLT